MEWQNVLAALELLPWIIMIFGENKLKSRLVEIDYKRLYSLSFFTVIPAGYVAINRLILIFQGVCPTGRFRIFSLEGLLIGLGLIFFVWFFIYLIFLLKRKPS